MPQIILKSTGKKKQYYVANGFYSNRFTMQNQFEPENYYHTPSYSDKNNFTIPKLPIYEDFIPIHQLQPVQQDQLDQIDDISQRYLNEAKQFAQQQQIQMDKIKREIDVNKQISDMYDPRIQDKVGQIISENREQDRAEKQLKDIEQDLVGEVAQMRENVGRQADTNIYNEQQQLMDDLQQQRANQQQMVNQQQQMLYSQPPQQPQKLFHGTNQQLSNQQYQNFAYSNQIQHNPPNQQNYYNMNPKNEDNRVAQNTYYQVIKNNSDRDSISQNPFYQPSKPAPLYVQELSQQFLTGVLQLEEAYQKQTKTSEAAHVASVIQKEREISDYKEMANQQTVEGLLSRVQDLECQTVQVRRDEGVDQLAQQILKKYGLGLVDPEIKQPEIDKQQIIRDIKQQMLKEHDINQQDALKKEVEEKQAYTNQNMQLQQQLYQQQQQYIQQQQQLFIPQPHAAYNYQQYSQQQNQFNQPQNKQQISHVSSFQQDNQQYKEKEIENQILQLKILQLQKQMQEREQQSYSQSYEGKEDSDVISPIGTDELRTQQKLSKKRPTYKKIPKQKQREIEIVVNPDNLLQVPDITSVKMLSTMDNSKLTQSISGNDKSLKQPIQKLAQKSSSFVDEEGSLSKQQSFRNFVKQEITDRVEDVKRKLSTSTIEDDFDDKSIIGENISKQKTPSNPFAAVKQLVDSKKEQISQNMGQQFQDSLMIELDDDIELNQQIIKKPPQIPRQQTPIEDPDDYFDLDIPL
ncbi:hypothetical protein SS50377_24593 [Spironucleus salmonicida]|uniref:Uncharacterized protein n=1 Tax=Spironucleus salmonicida TaxID=348837 RepID=V6LJ02_9EUKA|nr:hypothetical protein SS50377_24593 [Spironucleus salmonicida]|eukprot:EST44552.1 hypothetical protein SS50377_15554 [Spironucleus salmonicida]